MNMKDELKKHLATIVLLESAQLLYESGLEHNELKPGLKVSVGDITALRLFLLDQDMKLFTQESQMKRGER